MHCQRYDTDRPTVEPLCLGHIKIYDRTIKVECLWADLPSRTLSKRATPRIHIKNMHSLKHFCFTLVDNRPSIDRQSDDSRGRSVWIMWHLGGRLNDGRYTASVCRRFFDKILCRTSQNSRFIKIFEKGKTFKNVCLHHIDFIIVIKGVLRTWG